MAKKKSIFLFVLLGIFFAIFYLFFSSHSFKYLYGKSEYNFLPKEISENNYIIIQKIDSFIKEKQISDITSQSKNFDLQVYLKNIQVGVIPYLQQNDPLKSEAELVVQDILNYIKGREKKL